MKLKKMAMLVTALALTLGVSVCSADSNGQAGAAGVNCKDGVCEFVPASGTGQVAMASINPYNNAVADIEGQWESDVKQLGPHDTFVASESDPKTGVVFSVNNPIKNFKVLSLHFKEFKNDKPVFLVKELYTKEVFRPDRQLLVKFTFFGSIPNNGISYTDPNGKTRYYSISQSGMDGSLIFIEF